MIANNRKLAVCTAGSRKAAFWRQEQLYWSDLLERLKTPVRGAESLTAYLRLPKSKQDELKDVGGFVGGALEGGRRKPSAVRGRDVITLDFDNIPSGETSAVLKRISALGCAAAVYSTRKHEPYKPRLRVLLPLAQTVTAEEYEPIARRCAEWIGIEMCDPTTFQVSRLMYWPSCCAEAEYVFTFFDAPLLDGRAVLKQYKDWRDVRSWPQVPGAQTAQHLASKQEDPTAKSGLVGAFCRTYNIYQAIDEFLSSEYAPIEGMEGRYTYVHGSTTAGAIVYNEGAFLYSHHATDPAGGHLVNSFDLVRLHKFGDKDEEAREGTPTSRLPSYLAMAEFARKGKAGQLLRQEQYAQAAASFGDDKPVGDQGWLELLEPKGDGYAATVDNVIIILEHDARVAGKIRLDEFADRVVAEGSLPWGNADARREWIDKDDEGVVWFVEKNFKIANNDKIAKAVNLTAARNAFDDVKAYLDGLVWDGVPRLDSLLVDYLGAEDDEYVRTTTRKAFTAAVARVYCPGVKFDWVLILIGAQGTGKSTLLRVMGGPWFLDSLTSFEGKDACELLQGRWIVELAELDGLNRAETSTVKQFISRQDDIYRAAYGRRAEKHPRRCVFFGTTNEEEIFKDATGNRRFWPVKIRQQQPRRNVWNELPGERDQIWAEAAYRYREGEALFLGKELEAQAEDKQKRYQVADARTGVVAEFLHRGVPQDWAGKSVAERRVWWNMPGARGEVRRQRICAAEVWAECYGSDLKFLRRIDATQINQMLEGLPGLRRFDKNKKFGPYGDQRGFEILPEFFATRGDKQGD